MMDQETVTNQMNSTRVNLTIDGRRITAESKQTVLEAATASGIYIPTLCYLKELSPIGSCRVCLVEVAGTDHPLAACQLPVTEGMQVTTQSEQLRELRKSMVELLLVNHPLDCPVCERSGECRLQNLTYELGITQQDFVTAKLERQKHLDWKLVRYNPNLCVLCERCVRVCTEVQGVSAYRVRHNGYRSVIDTRDGQPLDCDFCGRCISVCPVGALSSGLGLPARSWELGKTASVCPYCGTGCAIELHTKKDRVCRVTGAGGINQSNLCARGRFGFQFIDSPERLKTPLIRRNGQLAPATWDEALDLVSGKLQSIKKQHGANAIAGIGSERAPNEDNYLFQKFFKKRLGSSRIDNLRHLQNARVEFFDRTETDDLLKADLIMSVGVDPAEENPVIGNLVRRALRANAARLITLYDRRVRFKPAAHAALLHGPGAEAGLIQQLRSVVSGLPVEAAGADAATLRKAGAMLQSSTAAVVLCGRATAASSAYNELLSLANLIQAKILVYSEYCNSRGVNDMGVLPEPGVNLIDEALAGKIKALYIMGEDPVTRWPGAAAIQEALKKSGFVVVQDMFLTPTAALADVVLPSASFAEREGTFTNMEGRVQKLEQAVAPRGEARADWQILTGLEQRLGGEFKYAGSEEIFREIAGSVPAYKGLSYAALGPKGAIAQHAGITSKALSMPSDDAAEADKDRPFILLEGGGFFHLGPCSLRSEALMGLDPECCAQINPQDAGRLNINDGDAVTATSAAGTVRLRAKIAEKILPGTVFIPGHFEATPVNLLRSEHKRTTRVKLAKAD